MRFPSVFFYVWGVWQRPTVPCACGCVVESISDADFKAQWDKWSSASSGGICRSFMLETQKEYVEDIVGYFLRDVFCFASPFKDSPSVLLAHEVYTEEEPSSPVSPPKINRKKRKAVSLEKELLEAEIQARAHVKRARLLEAY